MKITRINIIKLLVGVSLIFFIGWILFSEVKSYKVGFDDQKRYKHLFSNEYIDKIDTLFFSRFYRKSDCHYKYNCYDYQVGVIEIKSLRNLSLYSIKTYNNVMLNDIMYYPSYIMNEDSEIRPKIINYWNLNFKNQLRVNLNENSKVIETVEGNNYWGFIGEIDKMSFSDANWKHLMQFDYRGIPQKTLLLFKKTEDGVYIIIVNSEKDFGLEALDLFDL